MRAGGGVFGEMTLPPSTFEMALPPSGYYGFPGYDGHDGDGGREWWDDMDEKYGMFTTYGGYGFTRREEAMLLAQGVKPWEEDAHDVLAML